MHAHCCQPLPSPGLARKPPAPPAASAPLRPAASARQVPGPGDNPGFTEAQAAGSSDKVATVLDKFAAFRWAGRGPGGVCLWLRSLPTLCPTFFAVHSVPAASRLQFSAPPARRIFSVRHASISVRAAPHCRSGAAAVARGMLTRCAAPAAPPARAVLRCRRDSMRSMARSKAQPKEIETVVERWAMSRPLSFWFLQSV